MISKIMYRCLALLIIPLLFTNIFAADEQGKNKSLAKKFYVAEDPVVEQDWAYHKKGRLWSRVTNFGMTGDDAYQNRTPSCDWPGGSGNSYLYRGSVWVGAKIDGKPHVTMPEDDNWAAIHEVVEDSVIADFETYTRYYDVNAPLASAEHVPLGIEIAEESFSWGDAIRGDFIIYRYTIKNVGIDDDGDGYPDTDQELEEFYFTFRLDGDVSKKPEWPTESPFTNEDDVAGINASWDLLEIFPEWAEPAEGFLTDENSDSTMMFMFDWDNPNANADNGEEDDAFNPGVDGKYQTPGFLGYKILKTEPDSFWVSTFHTGHIYNDPDNDEQAYSRLMEPKIFEYDPEIPSGQSGIVVNPSTGEPFAQDYRGFLTLGPIDKFKTGDSVVVYAALGVGADTARAGIYSLLELVKIMDIAQYMVDIDFNPDSIKIAPPPQVNIREIYDENGKTQGIKIVWDDSPEDPIEYPDFQGYVIQKSTGKDESGADIYKTIATYIDTANSQSWPPPAGEESGTYEYNDYENIKNGFDYKYRILSLTDNLLFGLTESPPLVLEISPANDVAADLSRVKVVPNPYIGSQQWNNPTPSENFPWEHRLQFTNLPADATVKIFTLDLDFVAEVKAGQSARKTDAGAVQGAMSVAEWNLVTRNNQEAAPGLYIYVIESPSAGQKTGKFVIVR